MGESRIGLHGDLNAITAARSRNPLTRQFDFTAAMLRNWHQRLRFLVLEPAIRSELARIAPAAAARTDVLPLPINAGEMSHEAPRALAHPIRFGFVGQATQAKGIDVFLAIAREMNARHPGKAAFSVVGRAYPGAAMPDVSPLAHPIATDYLPRSEFVRMIAELHYVFLPYQGDYYRLAASGALIDAITWLKPVIAGRLPIAAEWFTSFGDIGHLCDDPAAMLETIAAILTEPDQARYISQTAALRHARASRTPEALAVHYRGILATSFPGLNRNLSSPPALVGEEAG